MLSLLLKFESNILLKKKKKTRFCWNNLHWEDLITGCFEIDFLKLLFRFLWHRLSINPFKKVYRFSWIPMKTQFYTLVKPSVCGRWTEQMQTVKEILYYVKEVLCFRALCMILFSKTYVFASTLADVIWFNFLKRIVQILLVDLFLTNNGLNVHAETNFLGNVHKTWRFFSWMK